jgi:hypothetical protein
LGKDDELVDRQPLPKLIAFLGDGAPLQIEREVAVSSVKERFPLGMKCSLVRLCLGNRIPTFCVQRNSFSFTLSSNVLDCLFTHLSLTSSVDRFER